MEPRTRSQGSPLSLNLRTRLSAQVQRRGEQLVLAVLQISRPSLGRAMAGLPIRLGTAALVEQGLRRLETDVGGAP